MAIFTADGPGRASKRRKLSTEPGSGEKMRTNDSNSVIEPTAVDVSSPSEFTEPAMRLNTSSARLPPQANANGRATIPRRQLNKTSLLALQVEELLTETRPNTDKLKQNLLPTLDRISELIQKISARSPALISDAEKALKRGLGIQIPFLDSCPAKDSKLKFEYSAPAKIEHDFTFATSAATRESAETVAIAVQMPQALIQEKDYLNHRAFHKRAFYLACVAAGIKELADGEFDFQFDFQDGLSLIPILAVNLKPRLSNGHQQSKIEVRITVTFPSNSIPIEKTHPGKNCLRAGEEISPTPMYNGCLRYLASVSQTQDMIHGSLQSCQSFASTSRLASIWLHQRDMSSSTSQGGFGIHEWNLLCSLLLQTGGYNGQALLSSKYSTVQLFKAVMQFLAVKNLLSPMIIRSAIQFPRTDTPVLYDGLTGTNLLFKMTPWSYQALREEAALTLAAVNAHGEDNFDRVFKLRSADPLLKFDEVYQVEIPVTVVLQQVYETLNRGFGDRVKRISIDAPSPQSWRVTEVKKPLDSSTLSIGLLLSAEHKDRLVDHGPPAEDHLAAASFRAFWGEKAELRRFRDGSIVESLVWSEDEQVTFQIIKYLSEKHFGVNSSAVRSLGNQIGELVLDQESKTKSTEAYKLLNNAYQTLTTQLHNLDDLPLRIRSIGPADAQLSSSSLALPLSSIQSSPANVYIEFENSTRWPDHLPAIQHTKIAFLLKLGEVLQAAHPEYSTRIGLENTESVPLGNINTSYLDIISPPSIPGLPPISFRLRITHDREITLIEKALSLKTLPPATQINMAGALQTQKRTVAIQRHTTMLRTLTTRFTSLGPTIRLLKKWASSHLLPSRILPDQFLDLLAIHTFTSPFPHSLPASAQTAFLRTLRTLSHWNWAAEPLLVDTSLDGSLFAPPEGGGNGTLAQNLRTRFAAWRKLDPEMQNVVLFVGSTLDETGVLWTQGQRPPRVVAGRLSALARASVNVIQSKGVDMREGDWRSLFQSPLGDFDFLVYLKRAFGRGEEMRKGAVKFKNLQLQEVDEHLVGFDAMDLFARDLEKVFEDSAIFFYDQDGGKVIAGLWNPRVLKKQDFRVRMGVSSRPLAKEGDGEDKVMLNQAGILAEIAVMGQGVLQKIEVVKEFV